MLLGSGGSLVVKGLRPHGRSGLKYIDNRDRMYSPQCLRPHGRSGLKYLKSIAMLSATGSPPTRAEWIEI